MVFRTLIKFSVHKRLPMIKFRKGGQGASVTSSSISQPQSVSKPNPNPNQKIQSKINAPTSHTAIEHWQLPPRFQRRQIDDDECDYINRGGPDKL